MHTTAPFEETNGAISLIEPFEPGVRLSAHVHENEVWLYVLEDLR